MTIHTLPAEAELRLECNNKCNPATWITLKKGSCELFGTELAQNLPYKVEAGSKLALFTWHGCTLSVTSNHPVDAAAAAGLEHSDVAMVDASGNNPVDGEEEGENE